MAEAWRQDLSFQCRTVERDSHVQWHTECRCACVAISFGEQLLSCSAVERYFVGACLVAVDGVLVRPIVMEMCVDRYRVELQQSV